MSGKYRRTKGCQHVNGCNGSQTVLTMEGAAILTDLATCYDRGEGA